MAYYRIIIWTKKRAKPYIGIREIRTPLINGVYKMFYNKAYQKYRGDLVDVEVQMHSKLSNVVKRYLNAHDGKNGPS